MNFDFRTENDFNHAHFKAFVRDTLALIVRRPNELLSYNAVASSLKVFGEYYKGVHAVPLSKIVGSTTLRYHDFDRAFLPTQTQTKSRWKSIDSAYYRSIDLPPVQLYQVGEVYFVRDGHHRVSVAREKGQEFIDAEIIEVKARVPLTAESTVSGLEIAGEFVEFLDKTHIDKLRPDQQIQFSEPGGYMRLIEHIAVHRYFMGLEKKRPIRWADAVAHWYDHLYLPVVRVIREHKILRDFPHRSEADLYLWIMDHHYFLQAQGEDVPLEDAAMHFAQHYSQRADRKLLRAVRQAVVDFLGGEGGAPPLIGTMTSEPYPKETPQS
jgi:hypothetical protein